MTEDTAREQLATCTRIFAMHGLLGMFGHISVYLPETQRVVICPGSGAEKATAQAEDTLEAGRRVVAAIGARPALLLRCHGTVSVGGSIEAMLHTAFILEDNARKLLDATPLGAVEPLSREECLALERGYPEARARAHW